MLQFSVHRPSSSIHLTSDLCPLTSGLRPSTTASLQSARCPASLRFPRERDVVPPRARRVPLCYAVSRQRGIHVQLSSLCPPLPPLSTNLPIPPISLLPPPRRSRRSYTKHSSLAPQSYRPIVPLSYGPSAGAALPYPPISQLALCLKSLVLGL